MSACTAQPISWLELERHALGELGAERAAGVDAHLGACPVCRGCMERIRGDLRELPRLVVPAAPLRRPFWKRWRLSVGMAGAALVAAAVIVLVFIGRGGESAELAALPGPRLHVKGSGEVTLELVRQRAGEVSHDPTGYRPGDQFQALITCSQGEVIDTELVVFEGDAPQFPFAPVKLPCGNRVLFPRAFALTGRVPVTVCAIFGGATACVPLRVE